MLCGLFVYTMPKKCPLFAQVLLWRWQACRPASNSKFFFFSWKGRVRLPCGLLVRLCWCVQFLHLKWMKIFASSEERVCWRYAVVLRLNKHILVLQDSNLVSFATAVRKDVSCVYLAVVHSSFLDCTDGWISSPEFDVDIPFFLSNCHSLFVMFAELLVLPFNAISLCCCCCCCSSGARSSRCFESCAEKGEVCLRVCAHVRASCFFFNHCNDGWISSPELDVDIDITLSNFSGFCPDHMKI